LIGEKLFNEGLIEKVGKTKQQQWRLSKAYYTFTNKEADYARNMPIDEQFVIMRISQYLKSFGSAKMGKFAELFEDHLTREQVKTIVYKLCDKKVRFLEYSGKGTGREYFLGKLPQTTNKVIERALEIGIEEMKKRGELTISNKMV